MKPVKFKEVNITFAEDQPEYLKLPAYKEISKFGTVVTCWKLNYIEIFKIMFTKRIWTGTMTFNGKLQPIYLTTKKNELIKKGKL